MVNFGTGAIKEAVRYRPLIMGKCFRYVTSQHYNIRSWRVNCDWSHMSFLRNAFDNHDVIDLQPITTNMTSFHFSHSIGGSDGTLFYFSRSTPTIRFKKVPLLPTKKLKISREKNFYIEYI